MFTIFGTYSTNVQVWRSEPNDWTTFSLVRSNYIDVSAFTAAFGGGQSYKNTFVPHLYSDGTVQVKALVQARPVQTSWQLWYGETARAPIVDI